MNKPSRLQIGKITDEAKPSPLFCKFGVETVYETIIVRQMGFIPILPPKMSENLRFPSFLCKTAKTKCLSRSSKGTSSLTMRSALHLTVSRFPRVSPCSLANTIWRSYVIQVSHHASDNVNIGLRT